jgi:XapX domain-containing protein
MMKILIGLVVGFLIGGGCRYFDIPVPSPPVLPGALLVVAMTLGYTATDRLLSRKEQDRDHGASMRWTQWRACRDQDLLIAQLRRKLAIDSSSTRFGLHSG